MSNSPKVYRKSSTPRNKIVRRKNTEIYIPKFWKKKHDFIKWLIIMGFYNFIEDETCGIIYELEKLPQNELMVIRKNNSNNITTETIFIPKEKHKIFSKQLIPIERKLGIKISFSKYYCNCSGVEKIGWLEVIKNDCDAHCASCHEVLHFIAASKSNFTVNAFRKHIDDYISITNRWPGVIRWEQK